MSEIKYMELDFSIKPKIEAFFRESGGVNVWQSHDLGDPSKRVFTKLTVTEKPGWQFIDYTPITDFAIFKWYTWEPIHRCKRPKVAPPVSTWQNYSEEYIEWLQALCKKAKLVYEDEEVVGGYVFDGFYNDPRFPGPKSDPGFTGCEKVFEVAYKKYVTEGDEDGNQ